MNNNLIIWPVLAQIILTLAVFITLGFRKTRDLKTGKVDKSKTALDNKAWSDDVIKVSNNIANQFQTPVLFYILCLIILHLNILSKPLLIVSWIYVISRYLHAYVHIGTNHVPHRMNIFLVGCIALMTMCIYCVWQFALA